MQKPFPEKLEIGGKAVRLIVDSPREHPDRGEVRLDDLPGAATLWIKEELLNRARAEDSSRRVHGLWQVLVYSGVIHEGEELVTLCEDPTNPSHGYFGLLDDDGVLRETGPFVSGHIPGHVQLKPEDGAVLSFEEVADQLKLPEKEARTRKEIAQARQKARKQLGMVAALALALGVAPGMALDFLQERSFERERERISELNAELREAREDQEQLENVRPGAITDHRQTLALLADLHGAFPELYIPEQSLSSVSEGRIGEYFSDPSMLDERIVSARRSSEGHWHVEWKPAQEEAE